MDDEYKRLLIATCVVLVAIYYAKQHSLLPFERLDRRLLTGPRLNQHVIHRGGPIRAARIAHKLLYLSSNVEFEDTFLHSFPIKQRSDEETASSANYFLEKGS